MKRFALLPLAFLLAAPALLADFPQEMAQADLLHKHDAHEEARTMLEAVLGREAGGREQAEIYWRLARAWLNLGDQAEGKILVPVVVLYRQKQRRFRGWF